MCICVCQEEVLMVQEAKPDCYKLWYLPAGRVEVGESLEEALRREVSHLMHTTMTEVWGVCPWLLQLDSCLQVKEEAGFDCEPISLLLIQEQGPQWIRFVFLARVTGQRSLIMCLLSHSALLSKLNIIPKMILGEMCGCPKLKVSHEDDNF